MLAFPRDQGPLRGPRPARRLGKTNNFNLYSQNLLRNFGRSLIYNIYQCRCPSGPIHGGPSHHSRPARLLRCIDVILLFNLLLNKKSIVSFLISIMKYGLGQSPRPNLTHFSLPLNLCISFQNLSVNSESRIEHDSELNNL